eukprot:gene4761-5940_t
MDHDEETPFEGGEAPASFKDIIKASFKDAPTRTYILGFLKNISMFAVSSMVIINYADKIADSRNLLAFLSME